MNARQEKAAKALLKAIDECHEAGLKGGVFESAMRVWPVDADPDPYESGIEFFNVIEKCGRSLYSRMSLDGGAGT